MCAQEIVCILCKAWSCLSVMYLLGFILAKSYGPTTSVFFLRTWLSFVALIRINILVSFGFVVGLVLRGEVV